jgi:hypothetical protein
VRTDHLTASLARVLAELMDGVPATGGAFVLNSGDVGLLRSLDALSAADASRSVNGGATIAAHALHLRYGLSLMNRWANEGGDPFSDPTWDEAWKTSVVGDDEWREIRNALRREAGWWLQVLAAARDVTTVELNGMIGSVAHNAYHLGAIRQIASGARGPRGGTFR